ncbi:hypothetical protein EDB89DRAFT_1973608 [Lactarius sanguifluus]|nr:hypothetical protein EDB89DRAFT_1973608 [Lactarius sanguifluus]
MFGPRDAETYYSTLLRREPRLVKPYNLTGHHGIFAAPPLRIPDPDLRQTRTPWVIDYMVWNQGTVIKQQIQAPQNLQDFLRPPIFFVHKNGGLGLLLNQAAGGYCMPLQGASQPAPLGTTCGSHAQIRINWRGYPPYDDQISIQIQGQRIIRLEKFVMRVARKVRKFMTYMTEGFLPYNSGERHWFIGVDGITPDDVVLIGVVHVSQSSWMPILQLNRFVL